MAGNTKLTKEQIIREYMRDSKENLDCCYFNISGGFFRQAANRAYYCALDAINACLTAIDIMDHSNHGFVIGEFRRNFIKSKIFEVAVSDYLGDLFEARNDSDYSKGFRVNMDEAKELLAKAEFIYEQVKGYVDENFRQSQAETN